MNVRVSGSTQGTPLSQQSTHCFGFFLPRQSFPALYYSGLEIRWN